jgi:hypothetical protein
MSQCPFCADPVGAKGLLPEGESTCPVCGNQIPSVATAAPASAYQAPAPRPPTAAPTLDRPNGQPRKREEPEDDADEPMSFADQLRHVDVGTAAAFALGGVALVTASISDLTHFTKLLSGLGLLLGLVGGVVPALRKHRSIAIPAVTCGLCLLVLLLGGNWPRLSAPPPHPSVAITLHQGGMVAPRAIPDDEWLDASNCAFRCGDLQVEITSVQFGPIQLIGNRTPAPDRCLTIHLRVTDQYHIFRERVPYETWADESNAPSSHPPELTDNLDHSYPQRTFGPGVRIVGRTYVDALMPPALKELLVFAAPEPGIQYLHLKLPASAFGAPGEFRFKIPTSMIEGF